MMKFTFSSRGDMISVWICHSGHRMRSRYISQLDPVVMLQFYRATFAKSQRYDCYFQQNDSGALQRSAEPEQLTDLA